MSNLKLNSCTCIRKDDNTCDYCEYITNKEILKKAKELSIPKYRIGRKSKLAILEVSTGREYLVFPSGQRRQTVEEYCNYLNNK